jgi:hypothetical protein
MNGQSQKMAGEEGFEPSHAGIKIQCLNQLGDSPIILFPTLNLNEGGYLIL